MCVKLCGPVGRVRPRITCNRPAIGACEAKAGPAVHLGTSNFHFLLFFFLFKSLPEDMLIDFRDRGRDEGRQGEKH